MTSYEKQFREAQKAKTLESVMPVRFKFESKGDHIVGRLLDTVSSKSKFNESDSTMYVVETDKGVVEFYVGSAADRRVKAVVQTGKVYAFIYEEDIDTGKGNPMKSYGVYELPIEINSGNDTETTE